MAKTCSVASCTSRAGKDKVKFYRFPKLITRSDKLRILSTLRLRKWMEATNRDGLNVNNLQSRWICSKHFVHGKAARKLTDISNVDWIPTQNLTHSKKKGKLKERKGNSSKTLKEEVRELDPMGIIDAFLKPGEVQEAKEHDSSIEEEDSNEVQAPPKTCTMATQTTLTGEMLDNSLYRIKQRDEKISLLEEKLKSQRMDADSFKDNDDKTNYFTGIPTYHALDTLFKSLEEFLPSYPSKKISKFNSFIMTLVKLKLDLPFCYLAYIFAVSRKAVTTTFYETLVVLSSKLDSLIKWPERDVNAPDSVKKIFGNCLTIFIDCLEINIESSGNMAADRNRRTLKFLIGVIPSGSIAFVSEGFDGGCSDEHITNHCGILDLLLPDDVVLADRGFRIHQELQPELRMPEVSKPNNILPKPKNQLQTPRKHLGQPPQQQQLGMPQNQLGPIKVESKELSPIRINVEQVIGVLREQFLILTNKQPVVSVSNRKDAYYNHIVRTCCALVNLSPPMIK